MKYESETKAELIQELSELRQKLAELEASEQTRKQIEEELKSSHEYLEKLNNSLQEVIFTIKLPERVIGYVNHSVKQVFGYEVEECIGKTTEFLYATKKDYRSFGDKVIKIIEEERDSLHTEQPLRRKNGEVFPAEITSTFLKEDGKTTQVISILRDITERKEAEQALKLEEARLNALYRLSQMTEATVAETAGFILEHGIALTQSKIGFVGFLNEDESIYTLHAVSKDVVKECAVEGNPLQWHIAGAGMWADAIRQRRTLFVNDYSKPHPSKKGIPPGHPPVSRLMVVPLLDGNKIVAVAGVGNKDSDYDESDERQITLLLRGLWENVQRNRFQDTLRKSEARLAEAQRMAHLGNWDWDIIKNVLIWSDEIYRIFGLEPQQFGATYEAFLNSVHPEDREFVEQSVNEALHGGRPYNIDHRIVWPDGSVRVVHEIAEVTLDENGKPIRMIGTVHDITEWKRAEEELRGLSHRLVETQENERRAIARELHDDIGQSLTALGILLGKARRSPADGVASALDEAQGLVNEIVSQVREMSLNLRPAMLDDLGLLHTLLWHFDRYTAHTQINVDFQHAGLHQQLPPDVSSAAYRIVQEALTNVARHASVAEVKIQARVDHNMLWICVEDRGVGFDPTTLSAGISSGVSGMRERARLLGGKLVVESATGSGTRITAELPLGAR